jgi:hypothetical protein
MSVHQMPPWAARPCSSYGDCYEPLLHTHHAKWWYRYWLGITGQLPHRSLSQIVTGRP